MATKSKVGESKNLSIYDKTKSLIQQSTHLSDELKTKALDELNELDKQGKLYKVTIQMASDKPLASLFRWSESSLGVQFWTNINASI